MIGSLPAKPVRVALTAWLPLVLMSCDGKRPAEHPRHATDLISTARPNDIRRLLAGDGIGNVAFGQPRSTVVRRLERLLGTPHETIPGICGFGRSTDWIGLNVDSNTVPSAELTLQFKQSRFVGYTYNTNKMGPSRRPHGVLLATARGLMLGDTVARARHLYGRAFIQTRVAQGTPPSTRLPRLPVAEMRTGSGEISAYLQGYGPRDRVTGRSIVESIGAGAGPNTPCRTPPP
jgi:hypothetical protein